VAINEHDIISQIQLLEEYHSTAAYVPGAQGECQNSHQKIPKSEKQHQRRITYSTYDPTTVTSKTYGQNVTYRQPLLCNMDIFLLNQNDLKRKTILHKFFVQCACIARNNMHICTNIHIASKISLGYIQLYRYA
jgi:hypothetical protein